MVLQISMCDTAWLPDGKTLIGTVKVCTNVSAPGSALTSDIVIALVIPIGDHRSITDDYW